VEAGGKPLIEHHLENLASAGFREIVINLGHLGEQLKAALEDGDRWGLNIHYSQEPSDALETGGGIYQALPLLGEAPFLVINGDIWTDFPLIRLRSVKCDLAHLVLVRNPEHNPNGDFALNHGRIRSEGSNRHTFSGISVMNPRLFSSCQPGRWSVVPLLKNAMDTQLVTGELYRGDWFDSGSSERLEMLRQAVKP
jgi:MurNAc alpha-1-phosphate uridylyltransferase